MKEVMLIKNGVLYLLNTREECITIPKNVKRIKSGAFLGRNLNTILVDEENKYFKSLDGVLFSKDWKTLVAYPENKLAEEYTIPDTVTTIGDTAFYDNQNIVKLIMPDSVTKVKGSDAFKFMKKLKQIRFSENLKRIPSISHSKVKKVSIPCGASVIGNDAFYGCDKIKKITIPQGIKIIEHDAFADTSINEITLPKYLTDIHPCAFGDGDVCCSALKEIKIERGNRNFEVKDGVLYHKRDKALVIYPSLKEGDEYSVCEGTQIICNMNNINLKKIFIPQSVKLIYDGALSACYNLEEITVDEKNEYYESLDGVLFTKDGKTLIAYPKISKASTYKIPDGVETIKNGAFAGCENLLKVELPDSITKVEKFSFWESSITEINLVGDVEEDAIWGTEIEKATIGDSVKVINNNVLNTCENLEYIVIPKTVEKICNFALGYCNRLKEVVVESAGTDFEEYAFHNSKNVTLVAPKGSKAEAFAKEKGFKFKEVKYDECK